MKNKLRLKNLCFQKSKSRTENKTKKKKRFLGDDVVNDMAQFVGNFYEYNYNNINSGDRRGSIGDEICRI